MTWAKIQFEKKMVNRVLSRCKNTRHVSKKTRVQEKDRRRLEDNRAFA